MRNLLSKFSTLAGTNSEELITSIIVIDVRTPEEFSETHVENSLNIDFLKNDFTANISKLEKNKTYKLYCRSGNRSGQAEQLMRTLGFKDVENIGSVSEAAKTLNRRCT